MRSLGVVETPLEVVTVSSDVTAIRLLSSEKLLNSDRITVELPVWESTKSSKNVSCRSCPVRRSS
jgi:hypothetical protein